MRLLLDTHVFLWSLLEPDRLGPTVVTEFEDPDNELWISAISAWETAILIEKERVVLATRESPTAWVRKAISTSPLNEAPVTTEIALMSREIRASHQDPADRFIAATAKVHDLVLVTADKKLLKLRSIQTMGNR